MTDDIARGATPVGSPYPGDPLSVSTPSHLADPASVTPAEDSRSAPAQVAGATKDEAREVAGTAKDQAAAVAGSAQEQAQNVLAEAKDQAGDLVEDLRRQLAEQSETVRDRLAVFLNDFGSELVQMAGAGGGSGYATQVVRQVGDRASTWGSQLGDTAAGDLLQRTRSFARRKPGTFLLAAVAAGVVAGRIGRGAKASHDQGTNGSADAVSSASVAPTRTGIEVSGAQQVPDVEARPVTGTLSGLEGATGVSPGSYADLGGRGPVLPPRPDLGGERL